MANCHRLLVSICFISSLKSQVYISPTSKHENISCIMNKTLLSPCYTISQIILNEVLMAVNETSIELIFLQGTHLMPENGVLKVVEFDEVTLKPGNQIFDVIIDCQPGSELVFNNTSVLNVHFLHFLSCRLSCYHPKKSVDILASVFAESKTYAINISSIIPVFVTISNSIFLQNHGAVALQSDFSDLTIPPYVRTHVFVQNSAFQDNSQTALDVIRVALTVRYSNFTNNSAMEGGGIRVQDSLLSLHYTTFTSNKAKKGGGSIFLNHSTLDVFDCYFMNNTADFGGTITDTADYFDIVHIYRSIFYCNSACKKGGAFHFNKVIASFEDCNFQKNYAISGGALSIRGTWCQLTNTSFISNKAKSDGGAVYFVDDVTHECKFICYDLRIQSSDFKDNSAKNGGGIFASQTGITYTTATSFTKNRAAQHGGALVLHASTMTLKANATLTFNRNVAGSKGGAMFINDNCEQMPVNDQCFITFEDSFNLAFENNTAILGKDIYGGLLDRCKIEDRPGIEFFARTPQTIMSDPARVCLCDSNHKPNCKVRETTFHATPGDFISLDIATVDQNMNPRSSVIVAEFNDTAVLSQGERNQNTLDRCMELIYHVFSDSPSDNLILRPRNYCRNSNFSSIAVHIKVVSCPRGFEETNGRCLCETRITDFTTSCSARTDSVGRKMSIWLSYDEQYLKVNKYCPLNYCNLTSKNISLTLPDKQCANHRSGVICGGCQENHSVVLGSSKCIECTSNYAFAWLVPVFAMVGIVLVAFLLICNMNISHGTINGLIFYANVVSISGLTSFQNCSIHPILTVFIAWVNLDFGIEICFYSGMDTYQKTWLQFAFPLYIWLLVGGIILASHHSTTAMKVFGRNNIAMLATLFLLSYTKLLKTIVTALTFTKVLHGKAENTSDQLVPNYVWLYDGNIDYLKGKHMPLFFVSILMLFFLFLPYTLLLTFGQFLHLIPKRRNCILTIIHSTALHSILDAYHAPYTKRHRYWTGLLLLSRCALILALFSSYKESNFLAVAHVTILVLIAILTLKATCAMKVYKNTSTAILEVSFLVNLLILSYYLKSSSDKSDSNTCKYISASISVGLITFIGILGHHAYRQICKTDLVKALKKGIRAKWPTEQFKSSATSDHPADILPTSTSVELRESLLATSITDD